MLQHTSVRVEYEPLVAAYWHSLTTVLRGFQAAPGFEFLETWVPDDDPTASILNIIQLAKEHGLTRITIAIDAATQRAVRLPQLTVAVSEFGAMQTRANDHWLDLQVVFGAAGQLAIHPDYRAQLLAVLQNCAHERPLQETPDVVTVRVSEDGVSLMAAVRPDGIVHAMVYEGAASEVQRGLLEAVCQYGEGKPLQECSDHAVIHVEHRLRDRTQPPPAPGIVIPQNADPAFGLPLRLVRGLFAEWCHRTGQTVRENFYDPAPAASWLALTGEEQSARVQAAIEQHPMGRGMRVVQFEGVQRVVVRITETLDSLTQQRHLMRMEAHLQERLEPTLQLYLEPRVDQNVLRQGKGARL